MRIRYTPRARTDIETIYDYLDTRSPAAARSVKDAIERRILQLADFPQLGPETDEPPARELSVIRYPYKVYYVVENDEVRIIHVRDARRRPWPDN